VSAAKPTIEETVAKALAAGNEMTSAEIAAAVELGRTTVGKALAALERTGVVRRHPGGRDGRRRLADRWSVGQSDQRSRPTLKGAKTPIGVDRVLCASPERIARWRCRSSTSRSCRC
jgi:DNA-binding transcriptional ArsR family regulator